MLNWIYGLAAKLRQKLSEKGQGMVEYALILAAVALIAVVVLWNNGGLLDSVKGSFTQAKTNITTANTAASKTPSELGNVGGTSETGGGT